MNDELPNDATRTPGAVIVSGATGAVGGTVARQLASRGRPLVLPVRSDGDEVREQLPDAMVVEADLLDPKAAARVAQVAVEAHGTIDGVVNVAGGFGMTSALELAPDDLERQLNLNLRTAVHLTGACLPTMVEAGRGVVLGVSAGAARGGGRKMGAYAASKAALEAYLGSVRAEVEPQGVGVSLIIPQGTIDTPANRRAMADTDPDGWISREAVAEAIVFLLGREPRGRVAELPVHA